MESLHVSRASTRSLADNFLQENFCNFSDAARLSTSGTTRPVKLPPTFFFRSSKERRAISDDDGEELSPRPAGCVTRPNYYSGKFKSSRRGPSSPAEPRRFSPLGSRSPTNLNLAKPGPLGRSANSKQCIKLCMHTRESP